MDRVWWNHITKAHKFVNDIVTAALEGRSIILSIPETIPWYYTLVELVQEQLKLENSKNSFETIVCPEEEVGLYLLNNYCKREKRAAYRYGKTYAEFLGESEDIVLNDRYIWVTDIPKSKYDEWIDFIVEYQNSITTKTPAIFILETHDDTFAYKAKKGIQKILFQQNIGEYDKFAFCTLAAAENNCKDCMRAYLAELVSTVCDDDIELCAQCVRVGSRFLENPAEVIQNIVSTKCRSNGEAYSFSYDEEKIRKAVWETQLKYVFLKIENYRSYFAAHYTEEIQRELPIHNSNGEIVENPQDVEIGTLWYWVEKGAFPVSQKEQGELEMYRNARNKLAHLNVLDLDTVEKILREKDALEIGGNKKKLMKNLWKKFKDLSEKGYLGMIRPDIDMKVWDEAFDVLMEIVKTGREKNSGYGEKLYYLDEMTDYEFKISVWLEDYLNEADMREQYDKVEKICKLLLETFVWDETESESGDVLSEANPVYFKFRLAAALGAQGKNQEAVDFCQKWYSQQKTDAAGDREKTQKKEDNKWNEIWAATALIYAKLGAQDVEGAGEIVNAHVSEDTVCGSENEILCTAALLYYQVSGKKEAERRMKEQIEQFQKENEDFFDMPENFDFTEEMSRFGFSEESGFSYENGSEK